MILRTAIISGIIFYIFSAVSCSTFEGLFPKEAPGIEANFSLEPDNVGTVNSNAQCLNIIEKIVNEPDEPVEYEEPRPQLTSDLKSYADTLETAHTQCSEERLDLMDQLVDARNERDFYKEKFEEIQATFERLTGKPSQEESTP